MKEKCKNKGYKGVRRPRCDGGWGCVACWTLYNRRRYTKMKQFDRHWKELKEDAPDWFEIEGEDQEKEEKVLELCWLFFMRGLELKLGPC